MAAQLSVQAIVFDLDDTLYSERDYVRSGYIAVQAALTQLLGAGRQCPDAAEWLWRRFQRGQAAGAFDALSDACSLGLSPAEISALVTAYRGHRPTIRPYGGVAAMLGRLHGCARLGLLSDGFMPAQRLKLDAVRLGRFFDDSFSAAICDGSAHVIKLSMDPKNLSALFTRAGGEVAEW